LKQRQVIPSLNKQQFLPAMFARQVTGFAHVLPIRLDKRLQQPAAASNLPADYQLKQLNLNDLIKYQPAPGGDNACLA
jgi:hypothetical protein